MRSEFVAAVTKQALANPRIVFFTGDLGFMAMEPLQQAIGTRFINAGVAEQNMVSVAAGVASCGLMPWAYSIAPFIVARAFEQIRDDVCLHDLDVKLVGNGGGYGYGVMGATHHMLEDFALLATLPHMRVRVPCFASDVAEAVEDMATTAGPSYLRLGLGASTEKLGNIARFGPWRNIRATASKAPIVVVGIGPVAGQAFAAATNGGTDNIDLWLVSELPLASPPDAFIAVCAKARAVVCVEEHYANGGLGGALALALATRGVHVPRFVHRHALGYPGGTYGSQSFHVKACAMDTASMQTLFGELGS